MDFASDNAVGASPEILRAVIAANEGAAPAYGADDWTKRAGAMLSEVFERDVAAFLVSTGTASNALALGALSPPWGAVFCHEDAHVIDDECGAPEMYTGGAKLVGVPGETGRVTPDELARTLARYPRGLVKQTQPAALSLSQANECGGRYAPAGIAELAAIARRAGIGVHMDGARFANALVAEGCAPADITWRAGVDVLSLGATKNGAFACEAVIFFDRARAAEFEFRRKRGGHTLSKGRFLGAQMCAWLEGGHWLDLARRANAAAGQLGAGLPGAGARLAWPIGANEVFAVISRAADAALKAAGARYHDWGVRGLPSGERLAEGEILVRLVCSWATRAEDIARFLAVAGRAGGA